MPKLRIMKQSAVTSLRLYANSANGEKLVEYHKKRLPIDKWLYDIVGENPFIEVDINFTPPILTASEKNRGMIETENAKVLFMALSEIGRSFATDERLWIGISYYYYYDFLLDMIPENKLDLKYICEHFLFMKNNYRNFIVNNTISRLWYIGEFFYRAENKENPFYLLDKVSHDINIYVARTMTVDLFCNPKMLEALIECIIEWEDKYGQLSRDNISAMVSYLNCLSGTYAIDVLSKEFLCDKLMVFLEKTVSNVEKEAHIKRVEETIRLLNAENGFVPQEDFNKHIRNDASVGTGMQKKVKKFIQHECNSKNSKYVQKVVVDGITYISLTNRFANDSVVKNKEEFFNNIIGSLQGDAKTAYNILSTCRRQYVKKEELGNYISHLGNIYGSDFDIDRVLGVGIQPLIDAGIVSYNNGVFTNNMLKHYA